MFDIDVMRTLSVTAGAVGQTLFVLMYLRFPWYQSALGKALFFHAITFAVTLDLIAISRWLEWGSNDWLFTFVYAISSAGIWAQVLAYNAVRRAARNEATT